MLFQAFLDMFGSTWATGEYQDYCEVRLIYNHSDQYTYRKIGDEWYLGLCSQKVTVTNIASEQYYYNAAASSGKTLTRNRNVNVIQKSPHYDSPWATAYQWCFDPKTEWIKWKIGSVTFSF